MSQGGPTLTSGSFLLSFSSFLLFPSFFSLLLLWVNLRARVNLGIFACVQALVGLYYVRLVKDLDLLTST